MTDQEILEKAIQKAIDGGWDEPLSMTPHEIAVDCTSRLGGWHTSQIIFNHDFAKALWGDKKIPLRMVDKNNLIYTEYLESWEHHLQQMVIATDPIKYLGDNI